MLPMQAAAGRRTLPPTQPMAPTGPQSPINNPLMNMLTQQGTQQPPVNPMSAGPGGQISDQVQQIGAGAPTPPINPVVDVFDNAPPIIREAIRRRLFASQGM